VATETEHVEVESNDKRSNAQPHQAAVNVFDTALDQLKSPVPPLRFSGLAHCFDRNGITALYHSLTHEVVYLTSSTCANVRKQLPRVSPESRTVVEGLIRRGMIVSGQYREEQVIRQVRERLVGAPIISILYLLLTDLCNLRCSYCYIEGSFDARHTFSVMTRETAQKGLAAFARALGENPLKGIRPQPQIIFYGGEPLLNSQVFIDALDEIAALQTQNRLPRDVAKVLITNGTVLTEDVVDAILKHQVSVSVSMDGPREVHDAHRIAKDEGSTFERVVHCIRRLQAHGIQPSISCTITKSNVDQLEQVLMWLDSEFGIKSLGFNMLMDLQGSTLIDADYTERATEGILRCFVIAREKGIYEDRIMRKAKAFVNRHIHAVDCGGCGNQIVVTPDGRIGPCQAYLGSSPAFPGSIDDPSFSAHQDSLFLRWSDRSPLSTPTCWDCEALGICGGGCAYNSEIKYGTISRMDANFCCHSKKILNWLLWDLYDKTSIKEAEDNEQNEVASFSNRQ